MKKIEAKDWTEDYDLKAKYFKDDYMLTGRKKKATDLVIDRVVNILNKKRPFSKKDVILDIGPGNGLLFKNVCNRVNKCVGVEASAGVFERLKTIFKNYKNVGFHKAFSTKLPFREKYFDYVVMNSVIHILHNEEEVTKTIKEIKRVSKDHAVVFIGEVPFVSYEKEHTVQKKQGFRNFLKRSLSFLKRRINYFIFKTEPLILSPQHQLYFSVEKFTRLCKINGLSVEHVEKTIFPKGELKTRYDYILKPL